MITGFNHFHFSQFTFSCLKSTIHTFQMLVFSGLCIFQYYHHLFLNIQHVTYYSKLLLQKLPKSDNIELMKMTDAQGHTFSWWMASGFSLHDKFKPYQSSFLANVDTCLKRHFREQVINMIDLVHNMGSFQNATLKIVLFYQRKNSGLSCHGEVNDMSVMW